MIKPEISDFIGNGLDKAKLEIVSYWKDECEKTQKALYIAVTTLERLDKDLYFNNTKQTGHIADSVAQIPGIALDQIKKIVG